MKHKSNNISQSKGYELPIISVIIPVFNVDKYLKICIDSVIKQTYTNLEILLINDGSSDDSGTICDSYSKIDSRVTVIHCRNNGVSSARNRGINLARGDYITFIDSDDYINSNYLEYLYLDIIKTCASISSCGIKNFDTMTVGYETIIDDNKFYKIMFNQANATIDLLYQRNIQSTVFAKLYTKDSIGKVRFNTKFFIAEDLVFNYYVFKNMKLLSHTKIDLYYYRIRAGSAMRSAFDSRRASGVIALEEIYNDSKLVTIIQLAAASNRLFIESAQLLTIIKPSDNEYVNIFFNYVRQCRWAVFKDSNSKLKYRIYAAISYLGVRLLTLLLRYKTSIRGK